MFFIYTYLHQKISGSPRPILTVDPSIEATCVPCVVRVRKSNFIFSILLNDVIHDVISGKSVHLGTFWIITYPIRTVEAWKWHETTGFWGRGIRLCGLFFDPITCSWVMTSYDDVIVGFWAIAYNSVYIHCRSLKVASNYRFLGSRNPPVWFIFSPNHVFLSYDVIRTMTS